MDLSVHAVLAAALFTLGVLVSSSEPPCHVVVAGRTVRPGQLYVVAIHVCAQEVIRFTASILRSGVVVKSATLSIPAGGITQIPLKVPARVVAGDYKLVVEGSSPNGNFYFYNTTSLIYQPKSVAIVVQTSRPVYRASQTVYFRILVLQTDLKAYDDSMDVFIVDSEGLVMRRWLSVFTNNGIASLSYQLPEYVKDGVWTIQVKIHDQIEEQKIKVENYFNPYFEVFVDLPSYFRPDEGILNASVWGMLPTQEYIRGNLSLSLSLKYRNRSDWVNLWKRNTFIANGPVNVELDLNKIRAETEDTGAGYDLKLKAAMTDFLFGSSSSGFAITRSTSGRQSRSMRIRFLCDGSRIPFKPSQPIVLSVAVEGSSGHALSSSNIENSKLSVLIEKTMVDGSSASEEPVEIFPVDFEEETSNLISVDPDALETFPETGVITLTVSPPAKSSTLRITAVLDSTEGKYETSISCFLVDGAHGNIALHASTLAPKIEEYAVFHLTADVPIENFMYLVVSKDNIVIANEVSVAHGAHIAATTTSFSVAMSPDMAPAFRIVVFATYNGSLMSDSVFLPLSAFNRYEMELTMNNAKDLRGDTVEIIVGGDEGAYIAVSSARERHSYRLQAGNDITLSRVVNALLSFEENFKRLPKVTRRSLDGSAAVETRYYPSSGYGKNPIETFSSNGLVVVSNLMTGKSYSQNFPDSCVFPAQYSCNSGGCYTEERKCDGVSDCLDSTDEQNCENAPEDDYEYSISRISRSLYLYDADDGDWAWREIKKNDHEGIEFDPVDVPEVADDWSINAFSVSTRLGFSVLEAPVKYSSRRGLSAHLEGPAKCRRGEQLGLRLVVHNRDPTRSLVLVQLKGSPYFKSITISGEGIISSYSATLAGGDQHILVYIQGGRQERLDLPVVPTVEQGPIEIHVLASSQAGRAAMTHQLNVIPEGALVKRHTSAVVNLQNRAHSITYLDIPIEETPVVPYQAWRRYIFGSPACSISFTGSLLGPLLDPEDVNIEETLDRQGKGTDVRLYEFGLNIWTLRYRRVTTTLKGGKEEQERLNRANLLYGNIMKRFNSDGSFANWDNAPPSVWLSAWVLRVFSQAVYADWEYVLYIDKTIFNRALDWIANFQTAEGKFVETDHYSEAPLDRYFGSDQSPEAGVALTAHIILALHNCDSLVEGSTKTRVVEAIQKGKKYLESKASSLQDPFTISIVVWALYNLGSSHFLNSMNLFVKKMRINTDGLPYWSTVDIPAPAIKYENQRPFRRPRLYTSGDSKAIEATSYGLLSMLADDGITTTTDNIVLWLQTMRLSNGGFVSMMDSLVAAEALTVYAQYARLVDVTKMAVRITSPVDPSVDHLMLIKNRTDISVSETIQMNKVWGHINVIGRGAGLALVQLHMSYGVDDGSLVDKPAERNFDLRIREFYSTARNKSLVTIEACTRWIRDRPRASGSAVLEVDIPTGYYLVESEAEQVIQTAVHPTLRAARTFQHKTVWFFDKIPSDWHCFNHSVRRWFGVANMTLHRGALLYEANARESFVQVLFNSTPLYTLSICEVCGSYQCPYCPYYNSTSRQCNLLRIILLEICVLIFLQAFTKGN